jgi:hypothetical protein
MVLHEDQVLWPPIDARRLLAAKALRNVLLERLLQSKLVLLAVSLRVISGRRLLSNPDHLHQLAKFVPSIRADPSGAAEPPKQVKRSPPWLGLLDPGLHELAICLGEDDAVKISLKISTNSQKSAPDLL